MKQIKFMKLAMNSIPLAGVAAANVLIPRMIVEKTGNMQTALNTGLAMVAVELSLAYANSYRYPGESAMVGGALIGGILTGTLAAITGDMTLIASNPKQMKAIKGEMEISDLEGFEILAANAVGVGL